ncbi:MAG: glycosyltransferase family 9 protein [Bacteroidetes bacterium]|nr:glycosyltransferase family 9 protein [Bacteroidota bacterium]
MKILILALSGIGDALMFTPALKLIRATYPDAQIDALVMFKAVKDMYERNPDINNIHYFEFLNRGFIPSLKFLFGLRKKYDISINVYPSNRKEYNVINFLIGAPKRAGVKYLRMNARELGFLNNISIVEDDSLHNVQTNIKLVEKLLNKKFAEEPDLNFPLTKDDENFAEEFLINTNIKENDLVIGFHPGSATLKNHIKRRWEPEKFIQLGKKLIETKNAKILIFGGPEEEDLKKLIVNSIDSENAKLVDTKNLPQSAAVLKRCDVFVTNDSSMLHIASAMKRKVVAIMGPTNPNYIHPWNTDYKIVSLNLECSPCFIYSPRQLICFRNDVKFKCIKELSVDLVYNSVLDFLK